MQLADYIAWYQEHYSKRPTEKLIEAFCKISGCNVEQQEVEEDIYWIPPKVEMVFGMEV
jgi:hypothetical protein